MLHAARIPHDHLTAYNANNVQLPWRHQAQISTASRICIIEIVTRHAQARKHISKEYFWSSDKQLIL